MIVQSEEQLSCKELDVGSSPTHGFNHSKEEFKIGEADESNDTEWWESW